MYTLQKHFMSVINRNDPEPQFLISAQAPASVGNQFRLRLHNTGKKIRLIEGKAKCLERDFAAAVSLSEPPPPGIFLGYSSNFVDSDSGHK
jgi:hypothetical protein